MRPRPEAGCKSRLRWALPLVLVVLPPHAHLTRIEGMRAKRPACLVFHILHGRQAARLQDQANALRATVEGLNGSNGKNSAQMDAKDEDGARSWLEDLRH